MEEKLYSEEEYARVKWYLVNSGKSGAVPDIFCVIREGYTKCAQMQIQLHQEGIIDLNELQEEYNDY
ncbi:hypothetical protein KC906_00155 [Candidatus Kaiserbacteria bacterium]|nr:hypothetical protein [Candidatus Kaiserbacteria bacterium]